MRNAAPQTQLGMFALSLSADSQVLRRNVIMSRQLVNPGLEQIQVNKSREKIPVRAYVVPECEGQQNKTAGD